MSNRIGKDALNLTIAKIITMAIALVTTMLLARFRTLEEYGTFSQILIVQSLATSLFALGLPNSTNYFLARSDSHKERQQFLSVYLTLNTLLCIIMGAVIALAIPLIESYFDNPMIREFSYVMILLPWTTVIIGSISNILVVYGKTLRLVVFNTINVTINLLAVLITQFMGWSFKEFMILYLTGSFLMMLWVYVMVWNLEKPLKISLDKNLVGKIFKYSMPVGLASLVGTVSIEIDKLMIGRFFDTDQLAIYTNASKELPLTIVATSLTAVLLPQMARLLKQEKKAEAIKLWGVSIRLSYIIICFCTTALIVFAPQIMTILYSTKYLAGVPVFRVYAVVLLLRCTYFGLVLNSCGKTNLIFYSSVASLALNIILNYLLYLAIGMIGPAIATFLSVLTVNMFQLVFSAKELGTTFKRIFPWKKLVEITAINVCWGVLCFVLLRYTGLGTSTHDIFISVGIGCAALILYFAALFKPMKGLWNQLNQ